MSTKDMGQSHKTPYDLLYQLGVSANYKGYFHTAHAVTLCMQQQERLLLVTKWLYPDVARHYGTNWKAVERNIRTASAIAWKRNRPLLEALLKGILRNARAPQNSLRSFFTLYNLKSL